MQELISEEDRVRKLCEEDQVANSVCQYFGTRERLGYVKVSRIVEILESAADVEGLEPPGYYDVVRALKKIAATSDTEKFGKFLAGRKGHDSRYRLTQPVIDFGSRLQPSEDFSSIVGQEDDDDDETEEEKEVEGQEVIEFLEHIIRIRDGIAISFKLPKDLTATEAKKLAGIIENLYA